MSNNRMYSPDMDNLNHTPSCDIFGYLMASVGVTTNTSEEGENTLRIQRVDVASGINTTSANAATGQSGYIFDYLQQHALLEAGAKKGTVNDAEVTAVARLRPFIFQKD